MESLHQDMLSHNCMNIRRCMAYLTDLYHLNIASHQRSQWFLGRYWSQPISGEMYILLQECCCVQVVPCVWQVWTYSKKCSTTPNLTSDVLGYHPYFRINLKNWQLHIQGEWNKKIINNGSLWKENHPVEWWWKCMRENAWKHLGQYPDRLIYLHNATTCNFVD